MKHKSHHMHPNSLANLKNRKSFTSETGREAGKKGQPRMLEEMRKRDEICEIANRFLYSELRDGDVRQRLITVGATEPVLVLDEMVWRAIEKGLGGDLAAIDKIESWINLYNQHFGSASGQSKNAEDAAKARAWELYFKNINSTYGGISLDALKHRCKHYEVRGGRGSGKSSWASMTVVLLIMEHPDIHALVLRKVASTLRDSVYTQYRWAIDRLEAGDFWEARKSAPELIYKPTGQKIMFRGADDPMKIKSIKAPFGYIGITHFEEKDQFTGREEIDSILQSTMRGGQDFWNFETFNPPRSKDNWANRDSAEERSNREQLQSSYLDLDSPEWLGEAFYEEAEELKKRDENRYRHEYLGIPVGNGGNVFENLELREIADEEIRRFDRIYQGVDWGWYPDKYAFIRLHYDKARETIYLLDEHVGNKITNEQSARWILDHGYNDEYTTCDSAEKKSVADYRNLGVNAKEAVKGPNSVNYGMKWLQGRTIVIDRRRTPQAYEEFVHYEFEKNRQGEWISGYPDRNNHTIDAVRYALERVYGKLRSCA